MASSGEALTRLTSAQNLVEAEMIEELLRGEGIRCLIRRSPAFDVPDFLSAGPRELFVRRDDYADAAAIVEAHFGLQ